MAVSAAAQRPVVAPSRVGEASVASPHVPVIAVAAVTRLDAAPVAQPALWLTLAVF